MIRRKKRQSPSAWRTRASLTNDTAPRIGSPCTSSHSARSYAVEDEPVEGVYRSDHCPVVSFVEIG